MLMLQVLRGLVYLVGAILIWVFMFCAFISMFLYFVVRGKRYTDRFFDELHNDGLY
jgi:hypothetical protein